MSITAKLNGNNLTDAILRKVTDYGDARAQLAQAWRLDDIRSLVAEQSRILGDIGSMLVARGVPSPDLEARLDAAFASGELDHRPVPAEPERIVMTYRDRQGDYWDRRPNGLFHLRYHNGDPSRGYTGTGVAEAELTDPRDAYAPMTAVAWAQNAESARPPLDAEPRKFKWLTDREGRVWREGMDGLFRRASEGSTGLTEGQVEAEHGPLLEVGYAMNSGNAVAAVVDDDEPFAGPSPELVAEVAGTAICKCPPGCACDHHEPAVVPAAPAAISDELPPADCGCPVQRAPEVRGDPWDTRVEHRDGCDAEEAL